MNMIAKGIGNYTGEAKIWYREIEPSADIAKIKNVKPASMPYASTGAVVDKKTLEGLFEGRLTYGKDYVAAGYINNLKPGSAKLIVKGIGKYGGVKLISFKVRGKTGKVKGAYRDGVWE